MAPGSEQGHDYRAMFAVTGVVQRRLAMPGARVRIEAGREQSPHRLQHA
jgi:hypothetical protein